MDTLPYLAQQNFDTDRQQNTPFGLSITSDQSDQAIRSELSPIFHQTPYWNNSTFAPLIDHHPVHSSVVTRQGDPIPFSSLSHHSFPSSQLFPQEPSRNYGDGSGTNSTDFIPTGLLLLDNGHLAISAKHTVDEPAAQLPPYGDHSHHFSSPHRYIPYTQSAASSSATDNHARTSSSRPRFASARKKTYPVDYERDVAKVQNRCRLAGAEDTAVDLFPMIFPAGITLKALTRHRTSTEIETAQFGSGGGPVYLALLEQVMKAEGEGDVIAYRCRLCPNGGNAFAWKQPKDALRHLKRDHFGLGNRCPKW